MLRLKANKTALYKLVADYVDNLPPMRSGTEFIKYSRTPDYALNWITPEWNTANAFFSTCMGHSLLSIEIRDGETGKTASRTTYSLTLRDLWERGMVKEFVTAADRPTGLLLVGEEVDIHPAHGEGVAGIQGGGALHHRAVEQRAAGADGVDAPDALAVPAQGGVAAGDGWEIDANIRLPGPADHVLPVVQRIACAVGEAEKAPAFLFPSGE